MLGRLKAKLGESAAAMRRVFTNPALRRLQLALLGSSAAQWAYSVAIAVYAYEVGGAGLVGLALFLRFAPAAIFAPFAGVIADRFARERVMVATDLARAATTALAALVVLVEGAPALVFALAAVNGALATAFEPAQRALLPAVARDPEELTAANVATSTIESITMFAGPALGALVLAATSVEVAFAVTAAGLLWSAALVIGIRVGRPPRPDDADEHPLRQVTAGFRAITADHSLTLLVALTSVQTLVVGGLNVLVVVVALEYLAWGDSGVGILLSAVGVGGLIGAGVTLLITVGRRLSQGFVLGLLLSGLPLAAVAIWEEPAVAVVLLALVGLGNTLVDVSLYTLLQRAVPDAVLARVFGVLESLIIGTIALGSLVTPALIGWLGTRGALVATGMVLPVAAVLSWQRLGAIDAAATRPERELALLRSVAIFSPLPLPALEHLAHSLEPAGVSAGTEVFRQGEPGDRFYVVAEGEVEVEVDGRVVRTQGAGDHFGEIALLRDVPRTATVRAVTDTELYALDRDEFIAAVTGHAATAEAADAAVTTRLAHARPQLASV